MNSKRITKARVFLVDDDPLLLSTVTVMLESAKYECVAFSDAVQCLVEFKPRSCNLLVTDVQMPGMNGIELLHRAKKIAPWVPVIVMTSYADIPIAVQALKEGAFDFIEKPFEVDRFLHVVDYALKESQLNDSTVGKPLTKTEKIVLRLILDGMSNKGIAYALKRSERTIEVHRSHIMRKLNVDNIVDLVKRASLLGFRTSE
ncbi:MAG: response regulator transcription factor [Planctomycetota bacterium]